MQHYLLLISLFFVLSLQGMSVKRKIDRSVLPMGRSTLVRIIISEVNVQCVAKLIEEIPQGFRAIVNQKGGGVLVSNSSGRLKIVWFTLPVEEEVVVEYRLLHEGSKAGNYKIKGSFSYLEKDKNQECVIKSTPIEVKGRK